MTADLVAWLLLLACPDHLLPTHVHPAVYAALQRIDAQLDLADHRDSWTPNFRVEVQWTRRAIRDFANAPPSTDRFRFPHREHCCQMLTMNRERQRQLAAFAFCRPSLAERLDSEASEVRQLGDAWYLAWVLAGQTTRSCQRRTLRELRDVLGQESYLSGTLPPPVPLWRFQSPD